MKGIIEKIGDTLRYNFGIVPEKEFYIEDHIERGNIAVVKRLIDSNPELRMWRDPSGDSLLHIAVQEKQIDIVQLLLKSGFDVNALDSNGESPLDVEQSFPNPEIHRLLVEEGGMRNT